MTYLSNLIIEIHLQTFYLVFVSFFLISLAVVLLVWFSVLFIRCFIQYSSKHFGSHFDALQKWNPCCLSIRNFIFTISLFFVRCNHISRKIIFEFRFFFLWIRLILKLIWKRKNVKEKRKTEKNHQKISFSYKNRARPKQRKKTKSKYSKFTNDKFGQLTRKTNQTIKWASNRKQQEWNGKSFPLYSRFSLIRFPLLIHTGAMAFNAIRLNTMKVGLHWRLTKYCVPNTFLVAVTFLYSYI